MGIIVELFSMRLLCTIIRDIYKLVYVINQNIFDKPFLAIFDTCLQESLKP